MEVHDNSGWEAAQSNYSMIGSPMMHVYAKSEQDLCNVACWDTGAEQNRAIFNVVRNVAQVEHGVQGL